MSNKRCPICKHDLEVSKVDDYWHICEDAFKVRYFKNVWYCTNRHCRSIFDHKTMKPIRFRKSLLVPVVEMVVK